MATDLAKLVVSLEAETAKYTKELERARKQLDSFSKRSQAEAVAIGSAVADMAVQAGRAVLGFAQQSIQAADDLGKLSQSTGIAVESLSELLYVADLSGTSQEDLAAAAGRLNKAAVEAAEGGKAQAAAFKALGVSVTDAAGRIKPTEQLLTETAEAFSRLEDGPGKSALAMDIFGKSGAKLIPFLNNGAAGLAEMREEARQFGQVVTEEAAKAAEEFNDNLSRLQRAAQGVVIQMAGELLPTLAAVTDAAVEAAKETGANGVMVDGLRVAFETVVVLGANVQYVLKGIGREIGGIAAQAAAVATLDFAGAARIGEMMRADAAKARAEIDAFSARVLGAHAHAERVRGTMAKWKDAIASAKSGPLEEQQRVMRGLAAAYQAGEFGAVGSAEATRAYEAAVAKALPTIGKKAVALQTAGGAARGTVSELSRLITALQEQAATLGMSDAALEQYKLRAAGANAAQLQFAASVRAGVEEFERQRDALAEGKSITEQVRTPAEAYAVQVDRLAELLARGALDQEAFNRAVVGAQNTLIGADPAYQAAITRQQRLNDLLASTPTGQAQSQARDLQILVDSYLENQEAIDGSAEKTRQYGEAFKAVMGGVTASTKEQTDLMSEMTAEAARNMQGALADFLFDPFGDSAENMVDQFANALKRMAAEAAAAQIMQSLGMGSAKSGGDLFGSLISAGIGYFTGTQSPAPVAEASFTPIPGRASGGGMRAGRPYWTGELGPELVFPGTTSRILSARDSQEFMAGGARQVNQVFNIEAPDPNAFRASERQITRRARQAMRG